MVGQIVFSMSTAIIVSYDSLMGTSCHVYFTLPCIYSVFFQNVHIVVSARLGLCPSPSGNWIFRLIVAIIADTWKGKYYKARDAPRKNVSPVFLPSIPGDFSYSDARLRERGISLFRNIERPGGMATVNNVHSFVASSINHRGVMTGN